MISVCGGCHKANVCIDVALLSKLAPHLLEPLHVGRCIEERIKPCARKNKIGYCTNVAYVIYCIYHHIKGVVLL